MGQNQALPVPVQHILAAGRGKLKARPTLSRLQQKVYFRIMPQRFIVADSFHRLLNRFFIDDLSFSELYRHPVPFFNNTPEDPCLHLSHQANRYLPCFLLPDNVQLRFLFLQSAQINQHLMHVTAVRQFQRIGQHRLKNRKLRSFFRSQSLPGLCLLRPGHCTNLSCVYFLGSLKLFTGIKPDLVDLLPGIRKHIFHPQAPAGYLQISQAGSLTVPGNLVHFRPELFRIMYLRRKLYNTVQQSFYPLRAKGGTKPAGKYLPFRSCFSQRINTDAACLQIFLHHAFLTDRQVLQFLRRRLCLRKNPGKVNAAFAKAFSQFS